MSYSHPKENRTVSLSRREVLLLGSGGLLSMLSGCTTGSSHNATEQQNALRYPLTSPPTTLDPATVQDGTTIDLLQNIYEGLVIWNTKSEVVPGVAERWEVSNGGRTYTFYLRRGVRFHNGREVTAADFKYSIERACNPATNSQTAYTYLNDIVGALDCRAGKAKEVSGVKVLGPYTLQIIIDSPKSYWLDKMTYPTGYAVCKEAVERTGGIIDATSAVGCGPFRIASPQDYRSDYRIVLTAFADYYGGSPKLSHIVRPVLPDASTRLNQYEAGDLDLVGIAPSDLDHVNQDPKLRSDLHSFPRARIWYLALNQAAAGSPFTSKLVRVAFNMAIDKQEVVRVALKSVMTPANSIVPPGMGGYMPTAKPIPFNPTQARALLAQAGYGPGGKPFPALALTYRNDMPEVAAAAQVVAYQLKNNLGITVQCQGMDWGQFLKESDQKTMPFSLASWGADYLDPQDFLSVLLHTSHKVNGMEDHPYNDVGYSNPKFDALCDEADSELDRAKRYALYQQAEQIALDDCPWVPLYFQRDLELIRSYVHNIRDSLLGHLPYTTTTV